MRRFRFDVDWEGVFFVISWLLVFAIVIFSMTGCGSMKEYQESVRVDTVFLSSVEVRVDSVYRDRYRNVYVAGDTVHDVVTEFLTRYVFRDRVDTVYRVSVDSVVSEVVVSGDCERSWYDRFCSWGFWILVVVVLIWVVLRVVRFFVSR